MIFLKISAKKILDICNGTLLNGNEDSLIEKYSIDTRSINKGDIYVAINGENVNGNKFIGDAFSKGAIGCIIDEKISDELLQNYKDKIIIKVENTILALQQIASYIRMQYDIPVIAITGSVGKTSTKDIVASVVSKKYNVLKTEGNLNNHIGLPMTILSLDNQNAIVVEMGMSHFKEISVLSKIAKPTISVITNIGTSHIGNLGSRENILKAKLEILDGMGENGSLIINNDNDLLHDWSQKNTYKIIYTYGINNLSNYTATNIIQNEYSSTFNINNNKIDVNVSGKHFIYNALAAFTVGKLLNIDEKDIIKGISEFKLTAKRMEMRKTSNNSIIIEDYYNASLESTSMALDVLSTLNAKKKIAVLGDILELGDFSDEIHKKIGRELIKYNIDVLITVGKAAKNIATEAEKNGIKNIYVCDNNMEAVSYLKQENEKNSAILIKASHGMNFGEIAKEIN